MKVLKITGLILLILLLTYFVFFSKRYPLSILSHSLSVGDSVDSYNGVVVYNNGMDYPESYGKHYTADSSFYYGKKWQCVEYIKRYYYDHLHFTMTNGMGNAKDFYDPDVLNGKLNKKRELLQFKNDSTAMPQPDDILIFGGTYGHVAIVTRVSDTEVEVIQQNIYMTPRETFPLAVKNGIVSVGLRRKPNGWLRVAK